MSIKDVFELIGFAISFLIAGVGAFIVIGIIIISAFPELIQPRGFYRGKIRAAYARVSSWLRRQGRLTMEVIEILFNRRKLEETLREINTGQKSLPLS